MVYDLGRIIQLVRQPKLQGDGDITLSEALSFFGDELSTDNIEFDRLTHSFGPGVVSLMLTKIKDFLGENNLELKVFTKNLKPRHELSDSISPLVMKIGVSELIPTEISDNEVGKKAKKSTKPKNPPSAALGRKPHEDSEQKSHDFGLWDDHDDNVDDQELSLVSSQQVPSNKPTSACATPESLTSPTCENDETDASGTDTISKKIAKLEQDRKIMEAQYTKQKKMIGKKTDEITYLNEKLAQRQKDEEKEHHKKKRRKISTADPQSSHGKRADNRKQIMK